MDVKEGLPKIGIGDMVSISHHFNNEFFVFNGEVRKVKKNSYGSPVLVVCNGDTTKEFDLGTIWVSHVALMRKAGIEQFAPRTLMTTLPTALPGRSILRHTIPCPGGVADLVSSSRNSLQESAGSPGAPEIPASFCPTTGAQAKVDAKLRQLGIVVDWSTYEPSRNRSWASQGMPSGTAEAYTVSEAEDAGSYTIYNKRTICFYVSVSKLARTPVDMYDVNDRMGSDYREIGVDTKFVPPEEPAGK